MPMQFKPAYFFGLYSLFCISMIVLFRGVGDTGDSVLHYLYAKHAFEFPHLFLDHWAKPVYVLLASPFAQLGFWGIKVFNCISVGLSMYFTMRVAEGYGLQRPWLTGLFYLLSPLQLVLTFSGLTEPLFALCTILSLYLLVNLQKPLFAALLLSFLPFIRSEGLLFTGLFGCFFLYRKDFRSLVLLATGHLVYGIAGWYYYDDLLWVFTKIPYASLTSPYGKGTWLHFPDQLPYVVGIPLAVLLVSGLIASFMKGNELREKNNFWLVPAGFLVYFAAHAVFWKFGLFNSMGLKRVLLGIMPFMALLMLLGYNRIIFFIKNKPASQVAQAVILLLVLAFPFIGNHASLHYADFVPGAAQVNMEAMKVRYDNFFRRFNGRWAYGSPYLSELFGVSHFDEKKRIDPYLDQLQKLQPGDLVIWDNWFCPVEFGLTKEYLMQSGCFKMVHAFNANDSKGLSEYIIFQVVRPCTKAEG